MRLQTSHCYSTVERLATVGLWFGLIGLAAITTVTILASYHPTHCSSMLNEGSPTGQCRFESLVDFVLGNRALQGLHAFILQVVAILFLIVMGPLIRADAWAQLEASGSSLVGLHAVFELCNAPGLVSSIMYIWHHRRASVWVVLLSTIAIVSTVASLLVIPIYRPNHGSFALASTFAYGGGIGPPIQDEYRSSASIPGAVQLGRAILTSQTLNERNWSSPTGAGNRIPFLLDVDVNRTFYADLKTIVAESDTDCSLEFYNTLDDRIRPLVTLNDSFWGSTHARR